MPEQLVDANLAAMSDEDLSTLAAVVSLDLRAAASLKRDGSITAAEYDETRRDAKRVDDELARRAA